MTLEARRPPHSIHHIASIVPILAPTTTLLISPSFISTNKHERRPSLALSAESTRSWERASDIYDDYRYSRLAGNSARSRQHSPHPLPQVLGGDGTMEADKPNEDLDVEKEMDDDG